MLGEGLAEGAGLPALKHSFLVLKADVEAMPLYLCPHLLARLCPHGCLEMWVFFFHIFTVYLGLKGLWKSSLSAPPPAPFCPNYAECSSVFCLIAPSDRELTTLQGSPSLLWQLEY